jgi:hypothetical protein
MMLVYLRCSAVCGSGKNWEMTGARDFRDVTVDDVIIVDGHSPPKVGSTRVLRGPWWIRTAVRSMGGGSSPSERSGSCSEFFSGQDRNKRLQTNNWANSRKLSRIDGRQRLFVSLWVSFRRKRD